MSGDDDSGGRGNAGGSSKKRDGGFWAGVRSFGSALLEGFSGGGVTSAHGKPNVSRRDPVDAQRPAVARQIHRSMKAWRERSDSDGASADEAARGDHEEHSDASAGDTADSSDETQATDSTSSESAKTADSDPTPSRETTTEEKPSQSVAAKLKGVHRKVFLAPKIFRMAGASASKMFGPHDSVKAAIADIKKIWEKTQRKDKLRVGSPEEKDFSARRAKIETDYSSKEAEYLRVKATPDAAAVTGLVAYYTELGERAKALREALEDFTRSATDAALVAATLTSEIEGCRKSAKDKTPDPNAIPVLQLPDFASKKAELVAAMAAVEVHAAKEAAQPLSLPELRAYKADADKLRAASDAAVKLMDVVNAMEPYKTSIDSIIEQNQKEGAETGDGSSEAAAMHEARTGQQVKFRWHGPKCHMDAIGLKKNVAGLNTLKGAFPDPLAIAKIDALIKIADDRAKGLQTGADAWKNSPHYSKSKFSE